MAQVGFRQLTRREPLSVGSPPDGQLVHRRRERLADERVRPGRGDLDRGAEGPGQQTLGNRGATDVARADAQDAQRGHAVRLTGSRDIAMISGMSDLLARHGPKLAVGGLVALNLVLIGALVLRDPVRTAVIAAPVPASSSSSAAPNSATTSPSSNAPDPTPSSSASATATPSVAPSPSQGRPDADAGWRATSTGCDGSAEVEVTTDGGRSWSKTKPGLTAIVRLKAYGDSSVFAVGADDQCRPTYADHGSEADVAA